MAKKLIAHEEAVAAAKAVKAGYKTGKEILELAGAGYGRGTIQRAADRFGISAEAARKLRAIASGPDGFTELEIRAISERILKRQSRFTITHLVKLLAAPRGRLRDTLLDQTFKQGWSSHRLQAEIVAAVPRKRASGRNPHIVVGKNFPSALSRECWTLNRWLRLSLEANAPLRGKLRKLVARLEWQLGEIVITLDKNTAVRRSDAGVRE